MNLKNSLYKVTANREFKKEIVIPTSKSLANRMLILASLIPGEVEITGLPESTDVISLIACLKEIGLQIEETFHAETNERDITIKNHFPECEDHNKKIHYIKTGDGGTTNRFLIPLLALGQNTYFIEASHKMLERPMEEMISCLRNLKVEVIQDLSDPVHWMKVKGPIQYNGEVIKIESGRSTQFASGMRMIFWKDDKAISPQNMANSKDYYIMTDHLCRMANVGMRKFSVNPDFSGASYPLAFAALNGEVLIKNVKEIDLFQADSAFVKHLEESGVYVELSEKGLFVKSRPNLKPLSISCDKFPDLILTLAYYLSYVDGTSELYHLKVLRLKESDRLFELLNLLKTFHIDHDYNEDKDILKIYGNSKRLVVEELEVNPPPDHRVIMVSYLFLRQNSGGFLHSTHHIDKSFPNFFKVMN
jgi:3-phosphoshikimate 1-carboxyvinyltransferase